MIAQAHGNADEDTQGDEEKENPAANRSYSGGEPQWEATLKTKRAAVPPTPRIESTYPTIDPRARAGGNPTRASTTQTARRIVDSNVDVKETPSFIPLPPQAAPKHTGKEFDGLELKGQEPGDEIRRGGRTVFGPLGCVSHASSVHPGLEARTRVLN